MKTLILGGLGKMGVLICDDLIKNSSVEQVILADINLDTSKVPAEVQKSPKVSTRYFDITESHPALVELIANNDIVINCVGPYSVIDPYDTVRAAIEAGVNYVDICDDYDATKNVFTLDEQAREAGVTICNGLGMGPGTANVLARYGADKLDTVSEIKLSAVIALLDPVGKAGISHALAHFLGDAPQYIDGRIQSVPAGSNVEEVLFMEPFGKNEAFCCSHPVIFTLPRYIKGVKTVSSKITFYPPSVNELLRLFADLGLASKEPMIVGNASVTPRDFIATFIQQNPHLRVGQKPDISCACNIAVTGTENGKEVTYTYRFGGWSGPMVSIPASLCAEMLYHGEITAKGVLSPEGAIDPEKYFSGLIARGLALSNGLPFIEDKVISAAG